MTQLETNLPAPLVDPSGRPRLLIVDDDHTQLRAIERQLRRHGDRIAYALVDNGIDALLQVGLTRPALVVLDVHMPGLDGVEVCRRLRANPATAQTRVIIASALMTPQLRAEALEAGAQQALTKPIDVASILLDLDLPPPPRRPLGTVPPPMQQACERRAADVLVDQIVAAGVEVVFGLPGGPISPIHDALIDSNVRVITTRHESGAMFAAAGYAHTSGKLGVALVTSGPGVLNAVTGLASAWCDGLPVMLLAGEAPRRAHGKGVLQDGSAYGLNIVAMTQHVAKLALEVPSGNQLPHLVRRAINTALSGRRGPVVLTLPMDVTTAMIDPPEQSGVITLDTAVPAAALDEVATLLRGAARPLILAGSGLRGTATDALLTVAERLGCPVATTPKGKGVFPEHHPLSLGVFGLGGHPSARAYVDASPDVVLAIGTSLGDLSTDGFSPQLQAPTLIHVDLDGRQLGKSYAPTHGIVAPAVDVLTGIAARLDGVTPRATVAGVVRHALPPSATREAIAPHEAIAELQRLLPEDTIYTVDSGEHFLFATHYLEIDRPDAFVVMTGLGSMGQSIGAAIGAQLAHPERRVAAIVGDGCFAMNAFEVATAATEKLPIRVFVFNDARLGMVEIGHESVYGRKPDYATNPLDVCGVAAGLGAATVRVRNVDDLRAAAPLLRDHPGPVVIDVCLDPTVKLPKKDRMSAFAPKGAPPRSTPRLVN